MKKKNTLLIAVLSAAVSSMSINSRAADNFTVVGRNVNGANDLNNHPDAPLRSQSIEDLGLPSQESGFHMFIWAVRGPVRANPVEFDPWSYDVVDQIYRNGSPDSPVGYRMATPWVVQPADSTANQTIWFAIQVVAKPGTGRFLPSKLRFVGRSTDTNNYLASVSDLSGPNITYTKRLMGIRYGSGGARTNDTILDSPVAGKISEQAVDELIFIGAQSTYFTVTSSEQYNLIDAYLRGYPNWMLNGTWALVDNNIVLARATRSIEMIGWPSEPILSIRASTSESSVGINMSPDYSMILYSTDRLKPILKDWKLEATVNAGDVINRPAGPYRFFKGILQ